MLLYCFVLSHLRGGKTSLFLHTSYEYILRSIFYLFVLFVSVSFVLLLVNALSTLHTALQNVSVSWFCDHRACISRRKTLGVLDVDGYA